MKKPFRYDQLSDRVCRRTHCDRRIKLNVLARNPDAGLCYKCFAAARYARRNNLKPDFILNRANAG